MKKLISGLSALAIAAAIAPMSAFAENATGGSTDVTFNAVIEPAYTITIPASVDLNAETPTATITAENVYLDTTKHKQINVTLDSAQYVNTGASTFVAKTEDGSSSVTYTIGKGTETEGVKVGDVVAEFTNNPDETADPDVQTATLSFSAPTGATYAGTHTEKLTFGISVEDAVTAPTLAGVTLTDGMIIEPHCTVDGGDNWVQFKYVADDNKFVPNFNSYNDVYSKSDGPIMQPLADQWAWSTFEDHETPNGNFYLTQTGNTVHLRADDGINMNVIDLQLDFDNMTYTQSYKEWYRTVSGSFTSIKIGDTTITASQMTAN